MGGEEGGGSRKNGEGVRKRTIRFPVLACLLSRRSFAYEGGRKRLIGRVRLEECASQSQE